jgi:hypothetical protein
MHAVRTALLEGIDPARIFVFARTISQQETTPQLVVRNRF